MNELSETFEYAVLSKKINELKSFINQKIVKMDKIFFYDPKEYGRNDELNCFKYEGSIVLSFDDGREYSFFGDEGGSNSICMRLEKTNDNSLSNKYIFYDRDIVYKIALSELENDNDYNSLLNMKIIVINILTTNNLTPKEQCVPSEKGLEFIFENGKKLILSNNLTENNFVFGVLTEKDNISMNTIVKFKIDGKYS